jgi:hypothetical protein
MAAVRKFDRWFAGLGKIEKAFAERFDGESWRESLLALLKQGEDVDRELMRGLLRWCSTKAPHSYGRGFALSLWHRLEEEEGSNAASIPLDMTTFSLNDYLPNTIKAFPELGSLVPGFIGNDDVGTFVSPEQVPVLRAHLEQVLEDLPFPYPVLQSLLEILSLAESKGMAYWEGTDLAVAQSKIKWLDDFLGRDAAELSTRTVSTPAGCDSLVACGEDWLILTRGYPSPLTTIIERPGSDLTKTEYPGLYMGLYCTYQTGPRSVVTVGQYQGRQSVPMLFDLDRGEVDVLDVDLEALGWRELEAIVPCGERILLIPPKGTSISPPMWWKDGVVEPSAFPQADPDRSWLYQGSFAWADLGDGDALIEWDTLLYILRSDGTVLPLGETGDIERGVSPGWAEEDGGLVLLGRVLHRVGRDGQREAIAEDIPNTMNVTKAPGGAWVMRQGDNKGSDQFKVVWPETGELFRGKRGLFGRYTPSGFVYVDGVVWAQMSDYAYLIDWASIAAQKRSTRKV